MVIITGASSGFGKAIAEIFSKNGHDVFLLARRGDRLKELSQKLEKLYGHRAYFHTLDVQDKKAVQEFVNNQKSLLQKTKILVNNAGLALGTEPFPKADLDDWEKMIDTNVKGLLYVTKGILPFLLDNKAGHVINIGSVAGHWVYATGNVYCASKHAVRALTEGLRLDLAGTGIRVSTVDPGRAETEFSIVRFHGDEAKAKAVYEGMTPLLAQDIAETVFWVATRPQHVNIQEIIMFPTDQSGITTFHRRS